MLTYIRQKNVEKLALVALMQSNVAVNVTAVAIQTTITELMRGCRFTASSFAEICMDNFIIIAIIGAVVVIGIFSTIKHFKGKGGCCGSSDYKPKKKKLANVIYTKSFTVEGMHCERCKARVEEIVNDIKGVSGKVDLKKGILTVSYAQDVDDETIKMRIERAGYTIN